MLPEADLETAARWRELTARIGAKASHGAAHDPAPAAWVRSGGEDWDAVRKALDACGGPLGSLPNPDGLVVRPPVGVVCDWGCGAGRLEPWIAGDAEWVYAADVADALGGVVLDDQVAPVVTDIPELAAPWGSCDLVVSLHVLYSLTPDGARETVIQLGRLLKPGGMLVVDIPHWFQSEAWHQDPDPEGLPGGWRIHSGKTFLNRVDRHLWLATVPEPLRFRPGTAPRWSDIAPLALWVWRKQP